jgi:sortase A
MRSDILRLIIRGIAVALIVASAGSFGVYAWNQWGVNMLSNREQVSAASDLGNTWRDAPLKEVNDWDIPVIEDAPAAADKFARVFIPAFGGDYVRPIAEGTSTKDVLNKIGVGHYTGSAFPGEVGNFAVAGHRMTYGAAFRDLDLLNSGDPIIVETADGWYTYKVDRTKIVKPTEVDVISPVPEKPGIVPSERWMTLTTCTPKWSAEKRLVVFALFDSFQPRWEGPPSSVSAHIGKLDG